MSRKKLEPEEWKNSQPMWTAKDNKMRRFTVMKFCSGVKTTGR